MKQIVVLSLALFSAGSPGAWSQVSRMPDELAEQHRREALVVLGSQERSVDSSYVVKAIELASGVRLEYAEQGQKDGVPLILLHGYTDTWKSYQRVLPHLPPAIHAFAVTQRGHGNSSRPAKGYTPADFAADIVSFMDRLQLKTAVIVGHSMGGTVAQSFAIHNPGRTAAVVLVNSFASFKGNPGVMQLDTVVSHLRDPVDSSFVSEFQRSTVVRPVPPAFMNAAIEESRKVPAYVWKAVLAGLMPTDFTGQLQKIRQPVLVVWGDQDSFCSQVDQERLVKAIPGAKLRVYEGVGHAVHWEEPERFAHDLVAFMEMVSKK